MGINPGSVGIHIQKIVDILETEGEDGWASRINGAYYSAIGTDAVKAALVEFKKLQLDTDLIDRLDISTAVSDLVKALAQAAGGDIAVEQEEAGQAVARKLLESVAGKEQEEIHSLGSASVAAQHLLDTLKDDRSGG